MDLRGYGGLHLEMLLAEEACEWKEIKSGVKRGGYACRFGLREILVVWWVPISRPQHAFNTSQ